MGDGLREKGFRRWVARLAFPLAVYKTTKHHMHLLQNFTRGLTLQSFLSMAIEMVVCLPWMWCCSFPKFISRTYVFFRSLSNLLGEWRAGGNPFSQLGLYFFRKDVSLVVRWYWDIFSNLSLLKRANPTPATTWDLADELCTYGVSALFVHGRRFWEDLAWWWSCLQRPGGSVRFFFSLFQF